MKPKNFRPMSVSEKIRQNIRSFDYVILIITMVFLPSAVIHGLLGIDEKIAFAVFVPIILVGGLLTRGIKIHRTGLLVGGIVLLIGFIASIVASTASQFLMGATLAVAIIAGYQLLKVLEKPKLLLLISKFALILLFGGVVGIFYALFVNAPLLDVQIGYRTTSLYLTTFSFAQTGNIIRPSGIFDEPGAFAMYAVIITMFNDVLKQNHRLNISILIMVVFTGSLAGLSMLLLYVTLSDSSAYKKKGIIIIGMLASVLMLLSLVSPTNPVSNTLSTFYGERMKIVDGRIEGDNRTSQIEEFFSIVDEEVIVRGAKASVKDYFEYDQSSHPFSIVFGYGLIISLPYFALLIWLLVMTIKNHFHNSYTSLGLFLILLQRPYIFNMMWSVLISAVVWLYVLNTRRKVLRISK